jgi:tryptophan 2,3-dioxygenase
MIELDVPREDRIKGLIEEMIDADDTQFEGIIRRAVALGEALKEEESGEAINLVREAVEAAWSDDWLSLMHVWHEKAEKFLESISSPI